LAVKTWFEELGSWGRPLSRRIDHHGPFQPVIHQPSTHAQEAPKWFCQITIGGNDDGHEDGSL
jgi:hypothetical protein